MFTFASRRFPFVNVMIIYKTYLRIFYNKMWKWNIFFLKSPRGKDKHFQISKKSYPRAQLTEILSTGLSLKNFEKGRQAIHLDYINV